MTTQRINNIIIGPGRMYRHTTPNTDLPDESTVEYGADWGGGWERVGLLMRGSGVQMRHSVTMHESKAEEYIMGLKRTPTERQIAFAFTVMEYTPAHLKLVFPDSTLVETAAAAGQKAFADLKIGAGQDNPPYCVGMEAFRQDATGKKQPIRWRVYEASIEPDGETPFAQGGESVIPIVCYALYEDASGHVAQMHYVTADAK